MKIIVNYILAFCLLGLMACEDVNSLHQKYLDEGEEIYTGVIDSLKVYPGNGHVKFTWQINSDPRITKTVIYWNDRADSSVVNVNRTTPGMMELQTMVDLPEGSYIFEFVTKDDEGHQSLYVQKTVDIYGEKYIQMLRNRGVKSVKLQSESEALVTWLDIEDHTLQYVTVRYTDYTNPLEPVIKTLRVENEDKQTMLTGIRPGDKMTIVSTYLPSEDALDTLDALAQEYSLPKSE